MKFLILVLSDPHVAERFAALPDAEKARFGPAHGALRDALEASGELLAAEGLADPVLARRVTATPDGPTVSDGPYAEAKEHLAGFYLVDVSGPERAVEIAAQVPDAVWGLVEVRPALTRGAVDV